MYIRDRPRAREGRAARAIRRATTRAPDARRPRVSAPKRVAVPNARLDVRARGAATRRRRARRRERCARGRARDVTRCDRANRRREARRAGRALRAAMDDADGSRARADEDVWPDADFATSARATRGRRARGGERERDVQDVAHGRSGVRDGAARGRKTSAWRWCRWRARRRRRR